MAKEYIRIQAIVTPKLGKKIAREAKKKKLSVSRFVREVLEENLALKEASDNQ